MQNPANRLLGKAYRLLDWVSGSLSSEGLLISKMLFRTSSLNVKNINSLNDLPINLERLLGDLNVPGQEEQSVSSGPGTQQAPRTCCPPHSG